MSFFASALRAAYKLSGAKKAFTLPEEEILKVIEKQNRSRGVFIPTDHKACYEIIDVNGFPCLIVRAKPEPSERAILCFFGGGMVIGPDKGDLPVMRKLMRDTGCRVLMEVLNDARLTITTTIADGMGLRDYPDIKSKWGRDVYCFFFTGLFYAVMGHPGTGRKKFLAKITGRTYEENLILPSFRKLSKFVDCNKPFFKKLMYKAFCTAKKRCDEWHDYEMVVAPFDKDKPIYYEFTACPAAEFAIKHGLTDIMPALCNVDYASLELIHAKLVRKTTCANGGRCDYMICGDKDPYAKEHPEYRDEQGYRRNK